LSPASNNSISERCQADLTERNSPFETQAYYTAEQDGFCFNKEKKSKDKFEVRQNGLRLCSGNSGILFDAPNGTWGIFCFPDDFSRRFFSNTERNPPRKHSTNAVFIFYHDGLVVINCSNGR